MDIISLGKANKTLKDIEDLSQQVIGPHAESHFKDMHGRISFLEAQADKTFVEKSKTLDFNVYHKKEDLELENGLLKLKTLSESTYVSKGVWESKPFDLGEGWKSTNKIELNASIVEGSTSVHYEVSHSLDGFSYSAYYPFNPESIPQARYIKLKITLSGKEVPSPSDLYDFDNLSVNNTYLEEGNLRIDGSIHFKEKVENGNKLSIDQAYSSKGTLFKAKINTTGQKKIKSMIVKKEL